MLSEKNSRRGIYSMKYGNHNIICTGQEEVGNEAKVIITLQCSICSQLYNKGSVVAPYLQYSIILLSGCYWKLICNPCPGIIKLYACARTHENHTVMPSPHCPDSFGIRIYFGADDTTTFERSIFS